MDEKKLLKNITWGVFCLEHCLFCGNIQATGNEITDKFWTRTLGLSLNEAKCLKHQVEECGEPNNKLYWSILVNNVPVIKRLLKKDIDLNRVIPSSLARHENEGKTPLEQAASLGNRKIVKLLLSHGADPNFKRINEYDNEITPLRKAVGAGAVEVVKLLLKEGADPHWKDLQNRTLLHMAISNFCTSSNLLPITKLFLDQGIDPNSKDDAGQVPLTKLMCRILSETDAYHSYVREMELLLDHINPHSRDVGQVPLTRLMFHMLLEKDAYPHHVWEMEHEALSRYQICNRKESIERISQNISRCLQILKLFVDCGADINAQDNQKNTLLHWAIPAISHAKENPTQIYHLHIHPNLELFKTLIALGADVNLPNNAGETPLDLLLQRKKELPVDDETLANEYDQIIALLLEHGAEGYLRDETISQSLEKSEDENETESHLRMKNNQNGKKSKN